MRMGIGLASLPFLFVLFDFLHVPIDWRIILLLGLVVPFFAFVREAKHGLKFPSLKLSRSNLYILIVFLIFALTLFMYVKGAFIYPYFEDDDPWAQATGVKYISIEKNLDDPNKTFQYLKPYPPGYAALMGLLHQTSPSLMWTMKFFNAFIASLGIIFFYFFAKGFMHSSNKAIIATVILAMVPSYLSHFIWAHSLIMSLLFVALYCLVMIDFDKRWIYPSVLVISSICLTQPTQPIKFFFIFMIYFAVKAIYSKRFPIWEFIAMIGGYLLSMLWWAFNWRGMYSKEANYIEAIQVKALATAESSIFLKLLDVIRKMFRYDQGSATRPYTFSDFFIAKSQNMINNPVGVGVVLCLLTLFSLFVIFLTYRSMKKEKRIWVVTAFFWLIFAFLGVNSMTFNLPIGFFAFRFWMLLAVPLSLIAAEGFWFLVRFFKQFRIPKLATIILLVILIFLTSGKQKYDVNTAVWGPGQMWTSMDEVMGYAWLKTLPVNTKVFAYSGDEQVIGFDKFSCLWCDDVIGFREDLLDRNISEVYDWLKRNRYEYLIIDGMAYKKLGYRYGENKTNELLPKRLEEINSFGKFQIAHQTKGMIVFKVV